MEDKALEKVAKMALARIPQNQIAAVCGISESRLSQIMTSKEYQEKATIIAAKKFEEQQLLNNGWDSVEALGMKTVLSTLRQDPDPEFALKAAVVANKAVRRGTFNNQPIDPQDAGVRAVIHLNPTFVDKLQQNFQINTEKSEALVQNPKASDFMPAQTVHEMLAGGETENKKNFSLESPITGPDYDAEEAELPDLDKLDFGNI